ncbi:MAG: nucleoside deaminase [Leptospiraceae bacterium]|nr:nucleoside deaminase [Leptospiraceae bacterium]
MQVPQQPKSFPPDSIARIVLESCQEAAAAGEVPAAAVICDPENWSVLAAERNRILELRDPTAHAELLCIRAACAAAESERLPPDLVLVSALEPCLMCSGAVVHARLSGVIFFAPTLKGPGLERILEQSRDGALLNHYPETRQWETFQSEYQSLLREFFRERRSS